MSFLSNRHDGRKPVTEETLRRGPYKVSGKAPHPEPPPEVLDRAIPFKTLPELLMDLDDLGATRSQRWMFRYLHDAAQRFGEPGTFRSMRRIAVDTGKPITTVRKAIEWLIANGFVARTAAMWGQVEVEVKWCLWLLPTSHPARPPAARRAGRAAHPEATGRALFMDEGARFLRPKDLNLLSQELETTDGGASSSFALQKGDEDGGTQADRPGELCPAAPSPGVTPGSPPLAPVEAPAAPVLDPAIAAVIETEVEDQADRDDLAERVRDWLTRATIESVIRIILEGAAAHRNRAGTSKPIHNLAGYCAGILARSPGGKVTLRAGKSKLPPSGKTAEMARAEQEADARTRREKADAAKATKAAEAAEIEAKDTRWAALTPEIRAEIEARMRVENRWAPPGSTSFRMLCLAAMEARELTELRTES